VNSYHASGSRNLLTGGIFRRVAIKKREEAVWRAEGKIKAVALTNC
jgi:hypothetical protein